MREFLVRIGLRNLKKLRMKDEIAADFLGYLKCILNEHFMAVLDFRTTQKSEISKKRSQNLLLAIFRHYPKILKSFVHLRLEKYECFYW